MAMIPLLLYPFQTPQHLLKNPSFTLMHSILFLSLVGSALAAPLVALPPLGPTVTIQNGTIIGSTNLTVGVDSFKGIPFAQPPTGTLRLKPPRSITANYGTMMATGIPTACPQFLLQGETGNLPTDTITALDNTAFLQQATVTGEDCLTLNVQRPSTATSTSKLPVIFWIYGGAFEFGSTQTYDATGFVAKSMSLGQDVVYVAVNYRLGGFGFLAGAELQKDGSTNLGLRDQRLALKWVQDNIEQFGGDPSKVTIWGESAGAISVCDHTIINGGDNKYHGKPLFRGAIMDSGSIVPADTVSSPQAQNIYDSVVAAAGCSGASDTLACLRGLPYSDFLNAANSVPGALGYRSVDLSYLPRPDPSSKFFPISPEIAVSAGAFTKVPLIIGDQEDEGTLFSLSQTNISTTDDLVSYLSTYFPHAKSGEVAQLVSLYPDDPAAGSPFRTGLLNNIYPQYKRLAAILGDTTFTLTRRAYLSLVSSQVPSYSYLATYYYGLPVLGTFHATDVLADYNNLASPVPVQSVQTYYISFANSLDPNSAGVPGLLEWPLYDTSTRSLVNFEALDNVVMPDTFRSAAYDFLSTHTSDFRV